MWIRMFKRFLNNIFVAKFFSIMPLWIVRFRLYYYSAAKTKLNAKQAYFRIFFILNAFFKKISNKNFENKNKNSVCFCLHTAMETACFLQGLNRGKS